MHHCTPPSKAGWPGLNVVIFPRVMRLGLDNPKQWSPLRLLIKFTSYFSRTAGFRLNQQLSNWASHVSGWCPSFMKIWTCGSSTRSGSQNTWTRIKNINCASRLSNFLGYFWRDPNDFPLRLVTMDETDESWLYHYDPETKQQSMEWRHSVSPRSKKIRVQKSAGTVLTSIFWDQNGVLLNDYLPKGQTINAEYYSSLLVQLKDILKEKRRQREGHQGGLVLARQSPGSPGTWNPEETGLPGLPKSWSPTLFSGSGPVGLPPLPWTKKKIERSPFFFRRGSHCCRGDLVGRTTVWIFWVACKS